MATSVVFAVFGPLSGSFVTGVRLQVRSLVYTSRKRTGPKYSVSELLNSSVLLAHYGVGSSSAHSPYSSTAPCALRFRLVLHPNTFTRNSAPPGQNRATPLFVRVVLPHVSHLQTASSILLASLSHGREIAAYTPTDSASRPVLPWSSMAWLAGMQIPPWAAPGAEM